MLIRFTVTNYLSFREPATLNMVKSRERQLPDHACPKEVNGYKLLRGAIIYGANAAGKSNLIHCLQTARDFIVHGTEIPQYRAFRLDPKTERMPASFDFEFVIAERTFAYGFEVLDSLVVKEWLYEIQFRKDDRLIYKRETSEGKPKVILGQGAKKALGSKVKQKSLEDLMNAAPSDKLIIFDLKDRNITELVGDEAEHLLFLVYAWFRTKLEITRVGAKADPYDLERYFEENDEEFREKIEKVLKLADTGIARLALQEYDGELSAVFPSRTIIEHLHSLKDDERIFVQFERRRYLAARKDGKLSVKRLMVVRKNRDGEDKLFELNEESDGTRRIIDLASLFLKDSTERVLVIDEMDRSLHPVITKMFHNMHYSAGSNSQLIVATHEHYLLSQEFYRRDEIWFVEKDQFGCSALYSLADYETSVRFDKDIRKDYLLGRYGAIPKVGAFH